MNPCALQRYQMPDISKILVVNKLAYLSLKSENNSSFFYSSTLNFSNVMKFRKKGVNFTNDTPKQTKTKTAVLKCSDVITESRNLDFRSRAKSKKEKVEDWVGIFYVCHLLYSCLLCTI